MNLRKLSITVAICLLTSGPSLMRPGLLAQVQPKHITIASKRFAYDPGEITLKKGEPVVLVFITSDVAHGIHFKELNIDAKISKGKPTEVPFTPLQAGDFTGHCSVFCGSGHGSMTLTIHVTE